MKAFEKVCIRLNTFTGVLSGVLIVLTMLVIVANIAGRYLFNSPLLGGIELCRTLLVIIVCFGLGYAQLHKAHIRVDLIFVYVPARFRLALELFSLFTALVVYAAVSYTTIPITYHSLIIREYETGAIPFPVWPARLALLFGLLMLVLQLVADIKMKLGER